MRLFLISYFILCCGYLIAQPSVQYYDRFDFESSYDDYKNVYGQLKEEHLKGKVKELKRISSRITLHIKLNRRGQIVEYLEYSDSSRLSRIKTYANRRIIKETEFNFDNTQTYIFYEYNKSGKLILKSYSKDKKNRTQTAVIEYKYDDLDRLVLRKYEDKWEERFLHDGDSIEWKMVIGHDKILKSVISRLTRHGYERVTFYKLDTLYLGDFKQRMTPTSEFENRWDKNRNIVEMTEYEYDTTGNRALRSRKEYEYVEGLLVKSSYFYNMDWLKGESTEEYSYTDKGLLHMKVSKKGSKVDTVEYKYDQYGNKVFQTGWLTFRYSYDKLGNWLSMESFHKEKSSYKQIRGGVTTSEKFKEDTWLTEERRKIVFF